MRAAIWPMFASYASSIRTSKWTDSHRIRSRGCWRIHPLSPRLASASQHIELEPGEHELNAFQAIRRMDEC